MDGPLDEQIIDLWETSELFAVMIRASLSDCRLEDNKGKNIKGNETKGLCFLQKWILQELS